MIRQATQKPHEARGKSGRPRGARGSLGRPRGARGNAALAAALLLMPMALLAGMGIDFGRAWLAQDRLHQAVDAAALAGARVLGSRDPAIDARMFFDANFATPDGLTVVDLRIVPSADGQTLEVMAAGTMRTSFLGLAGDQWKTLPITANATARRTTLGMELALVLDVTGSMAGNAITQMKLAASDLVQILFGNQSSLETLFVSVVPYSSAVNLGANRAGWLDGGASALAGFGGLHWRGCVEARTGGEDMTDTPPGEAPFRPFHYPSTRAQTATRAWGTKANGDPVFGDADWGTMPVITSGEAPDPDDVNTVNPKQSFTNANNRKGPNVGCGQPVAGLTNDRDAILDIIGSLQPAFRGGTMGNTGLQAGWMTLSPRWRGLWGTSPWGTTTPAGLPLDYPDRRAFMTKVIVMMTDGANGWFDYGRPPAQDYTAYGRLPEGRLGTTNAGQATNQINARMLTMCDRIKASGIIVYTITLGTTPANQALYRQCASGPGYYFHAPSASALRGAFREIGSQLGNLRLER